MVTVIALIEPITDVPPRRFVALREDHQISNTAFEFGGKHRAEVAFFHQVADFRHLGFAFEPACEETLRFIEHVIFDVEEHVACGTRRDEQLSIAVRFEETLNPVEARVGVEKGRGAWIHFGGAMIRRH